MFSKLSKQSEIRNILVISLSNIGDIIMICPAIDVLLNDFPQAKLSIVVGPKGRTVFEGNPNIDRVHIYDKHDTIGKKIEWFFALRERKFDVVVDFRNSVMPFFLNTRFRTPPELFLPKKIHLTSKHLLRLRSVYDFQERTDLRKAIVISPKDRAHIDGLLADHISFGKQFVLVAPLAADSAKTWSPSAFAQVCDELIRRHGFKVVMVGGAEDIKVIEGIQNQMKHPILNLAGKTNLVQVAELLNRSLFGIVHDSGIMHMASYFGRQVLALYGPTDPYKSGPWSANSGYIWKNKECRKCANPKLEELHSCMQAITPEDVLNAIEITDRGVSFKCGCETYE